MKKSLIFVIAAALSAVFALSGCAQKESKELTIYCALPETEIPMYLDGKQ